MFNYKEKDKNRILKYASLLPVILLMICLVACRDDEIDDKLKEINSDKQTVVTDSKEPSGESTVSEETISEKITPEETTSEPVTSEDNTTVELTSEETTTQPPTPQPPTTQPPTTQPPTTQPPETEPPTKKPDDYVIDIKEPSASGTDISDMNGYIIDYSNINNGYVMVKMNVNAEAVIRVHIDNSKGTLIGQYALKQSSNYVAIPLTKGTGTYCIRILQKNPSSGKYGEVNAITQYATLPDRTEPFMYPNVYVYYTKTSTAVDLSYKLCSGLNSDGEKVKAMYEYIIKNISYDNDFAKIATAGYMDTERCLRNRKGICGDYSALFATMCRAQGIPCIVIEGYVTTREQVYHAWNQVYYDGKWHFYDTTFDAGGGKGSNYSESFRY